MQFDDILKNIKPLCNTLYFYNPEIRIRNMFSLPLLSSFMYVSMKRGVLVTCVRVHVRVPCVYVSTPLCVSTFWELITRKNQCMTLVYSGRLLINLRPHSILSHFRLSTDTKTCEHRSKTHESIRSVYTEGTIILMSIIEHS